MAAGSTRPPLRGRRSPASARPERPPALLEEVARAQGLSLGRAVHRTARVARTIADLARERTVPRAAVLEALLFRPGAALTSLKVA